MKMTPIERSQWNTKFILELISILIVFGSIFASFKLNDYRVSQCEGEIQSHIELDMRQTEAIKGDLHSIDTKQEVIKSDMRHVKESIDEIKRKL